MAHEAVHSPYRGPGDPPQRGPDKANVKKPDVNSAYRIMMEEMDKGVGEVLDVIQRLGLAEKTLVFFFSDNGATKNGSNGPLRGFKESNWEGGRRGAPVESCHGDGTFWA